MLFKKIGALSLLMSFLFLYSCSNSPTSISEANSIKISIKSVGTQNAATSTNLQKSAAGVTITSVRVVIDEIELESSNEDSLDFELEQPFIEDLMVGSATHEIKTVQVPPGTYKELEIEIDELNPEDGSVYTDNPDLQNRSILIQGYLNGDPNDTFEFASDLEEEQEQEFNPPIVLDATSPSTNVVLTLNMDLWFVDSNNNFLDPRVASNKSAIEENIKKSIDIFEDEDDDGEKDDDDD